MLILFIRKLRKVGLSLSLFVSGKPLEAVLEMTQHFYNSPFFGTKEFSLFESFLSQKREHDVLRLKKGVYFCFLVTRKKSAPHHFCLLPNKTEVFMNS